MTDAVPLRDLSGMHRRLRLTGSVIALFALLAYFAQGAAAAACVPAMAHGDAAAMPGDMQHGDASHGTPADAPACPLGMLMSGTCSIAFLPAPAALVTTGVPQAVVSVTTAAGARDLVIVAPPFHPPRA